ncbi:MAG: hypothetical protein ABJ308_05715 [Halieaceae bacterium]
MMRSCWSICLLLLSLTATAQEAVVTLRATVTGNREQPKVMYIVPWQQPGATEFEYQPAAALAEDLFQRLDRDEFVRELEYREMLTPGSAEPDHQD